VFAAPFAQRHHRNLWGDFMFTRSLHAGPRVPAPRTTFPNSAAYQRVLRGAADRILNEPGNASPSNGTASAFWHRVLKPRVASFFSATTSGFTGNAHDTNFIVFAKSLCGLFVSLPHASQAQKTEL